MQTRILQSAVLNVWKYMNTTFEQYHRLKFKNRMFSLRNDLLSQFCELFVNSFLTVHDIPLITEFVDIKQSNVKN